MSQPTETTTTTETTQNDIHTLHKSLTTQAATLLSELTAYHTYLNTLLTNKTSTTQLPLITNPATLLNKFEVDVRREVDHLLKYADTDDGTAGQKRDETRKGEDGNGDGEVDLDGIHRIRSSNITFLADVWEGVKRGKGVVGVRKGVRYYPIPASSPDNKVMHQNGQAEEEEVNRTGKGIKGASKKMNREARERVKRERKMQSQNSTQQPPNTSTSTPNHHTTNGTIAHKPPPPASIPSVSPIHPQKTRGKLYPHKSKETVTIDIITNHGATWIKMFTKNERWLLLDLAKEGIVYDESDQNSDQEDDDSALEELKLVKMAREFMAAARTSRVGRGHRHPRVEFHLSKIGRGGEGEGAREVERVVGYLRRVGVVIVTREDLDGSIGDERDGDDRHGNKNGNGTMENGVDGSGRCELSLQKAFERMACPLPPVPITETLNVDCTILIALISDVSHARQSDIQIPLHYQGTARRDIEVQLQTDIEDPLLPNHIYPILRGRRLVCTRKATEHWTNIVRVMGSPTEAERCRIFLGEAGHDSSGLTARQRLQTLSVHDVPKNLQLPFEVVDFDLDEMGAQADDTDCKQVEIDVMRKLAKEPRLSSLNSSVFFHGWYKGLTTVSLNRVVSEWLNRAINVILDDLELHAGMTSDIAGEMGFCGANVLICGRERSLLGSEK